MVILDKEILSNGIFEKRKWVSFKERAKLFFLLDYKLFLLLVIVEQKQAITRM